jgi:lipopolysaccharide transport protein LptA
MAVFNRNSHRFTACALAVAVLATSAVAAQKPALTEPFQYFADAVKIDLRNDMLDISGNVRVLQGPMSIESQTATARNSRANNSHWTFEKSVHISTAEADLHSNSASANIVNGQIANARIEGSPAEFQQRGGQEGRQVRGRAGVIDYDPIAGILKLTDQVWFSNGKDEFRGDVVIYNLRDERVQINPGGQPSGRVRGIIRPRDNTAGGTPDAGTGAQTVPPEKGSDGQVANESGA